MTPRCPKCRELMFDATVYGRAWKNGTTTRVWKCKVCGGVTLHRFVMPIYPLRKVVVEDAV